MRNAQSTSGLAGRAYTVKSLVKALNILEVLAEGEESAYTLTQLSRFLHLHISTVHRLLVNLVRQGFVEEAPISHAYQLSYKVLRMGLRVLGRLDFRRVAQPLLWELSQQTKETVLLAILQENRRLPGITEAPPFTAASAGLRPGATGETRPPETRAICIEAFGSPQPVGFDSRFSGVMPLHCTGVGKVLLAYQRGDYLTQLARTSSLPRFTRHTITNLANLRKELEQVREQGYALEQEEAVEGLISVAGPVFDHTGCVLAAFSVTGPAKRLTPARLPEIARLVRATSQQISSRLGYRSAAIRDEGLGTRD